MPALRCGAGVSIHAFRGEGDVGVSDRTDFPTVVSIHAFRGEGDAYDAAYVAYASGCFNPRLPGGRRLGQRDVIRDDVAVSIHAFRGEGDRNI